MKNDVFYDGKIYIHKDWGKRLAFWGLVLLLIIVAGANTDNPDLLSSSVEYQLDRLYQGEWLNYIIKIFFVKFGLSFEVYHLFLYIVSYILIFTTLKNYCGYLMSPIFLYIIYPFSIDFTQTPNFCSMALFIFSINFLFKTGFKNKLLFVLFVLLASGMQILSLVYLPLVFLYDFLKKWKPITVLEILVFLGVFFSLLDRKFRIMGLIGKYVLGIKMGDIRAEFYFSENTQWGFVLYSGLQIWLLILAYCANNKIKKSNINELSKKFSEAVYIISLYGLFFMPLFMYGGAFFRITRNYIILIYFLICYVINIEKDIRKKLVYIILLVSFAIFTFYSFTGVTREYYFDIFNNNWILNKNQNLILK